MECTHAHTLLLDRRRDRLAADLRTDLDAHLASCGDCRERDRVDAELSRVLEERLPRPRAPESLRAAIQAKAARKVELPRRSKATPRTVAIASAFAAMTAIAAAGVVHWRASSMQAISDPLVVEAINDHLRVLYSEHPIEIASGGVHQVKPWFAGRLDFAPPLAFGGDDDFPLQGGAVAYFVDRKAATFVFKRRLHLISLFVFRADGLQIPSTGALSLGRVHAATDTSRGFHVVLWRDGDLGYALVSDVDPKELETLAKKVVGG